MIIALEGGICGGKTSLAKELTKYSYLMVPEYMDFITPTEQQQLDNLHNAGENALGLLLKIEKRRKDTYLNKSSNIVLDRSFLTLFAYEYAMNGDDCSRFLADKEIMSQVIQPDLVVYLDVNGDTRRQRCYDRGDFDMPEFYLDEKFNNKNKDFFLTKTNFQTLFLNTDNLNAQEMAKQISKIDTATTAHLHNFFYNQKLSR